MILESHGSGTCILHPFLILIIHAVRVERPRAKDFLWQAIGEQHFPGARSTVLFYSQKLRSKHETRTRTSQSSLYHNLGSTIKLLRWLSISRYIDKIKVLAPNLLEPANAGVDVTQCGNNVELGKFHMLFISNTFNNEKNYAIFMRRVTPSYWKQHHWFFKDDTLNIFQFVQAAEHVVFQNHWSLRNRSETAQNWSKNFPAKFGFKKQVFMYSNLFHCGIILFIENHSNMAGFCNFQHIFIRHLIKKS